MTSSFVPLLRSVHSSVTRPLRLDTAVQTLLRFLISYAKWLIAIPPLPTAGFWKITTFAFCSTPVSSAAVVHTKVLVQLCWNAQSIGGGGYNFGLPCSLGHGHFSLLLHHLHFPEIVSLHAGHWLPILVSNPPCLSGAECNSVHSSYPPHLSAIQLMSTASVHHGDGLEFLSGLFAECSIISLAVWAFLLREAAHSSVFCYAADCIAPTLTR